MTGEGKREKDDIEHDVLLYFRQDAQIRGLYERLHQYDKERLRAAFAALRELGYLAKTNPRATWAATYCITTKGRRWMRSEYGVELPPDEQTLQ